jgi:phenylalanyl-tRNA synthetase beta chain
MILDICGGNASELVIAGAVPAQDRRVTLRPSRVKTLGGLDVPQTRQVEILTALGFTVRETEEGLECQVPSFRPDIRGEADLVEEVCRIIGLDKVPATPMRWPARCSRHCSGASWRCGGGSRASASTRP